MNKYVKIKSGYKIYPNWFLYFDNTMSFDELLKLNDSSQEKRVKNFINSHQPNPQMNDTFLILKPRNWEDTFRQVGKPLLIRDDATFMTLSKDCKIIETIYCNHFPVTSTADIVICENDKNAELFWVQYLQKRFKGKTIKTINFFNTRTDDEIQEHFKGAAELITFSTTFSSFEWFKSIIRNKLDNQKIIGYSHQQDKWETAKQIYTDIEIVNFVDGV